MTPAQSTPDISPPPIPLDIATATKDPYAGNPYASPGPLDVYVLRFNRAVIASLSPEGQAFVTANITDYSPISQMARTSEFNALKSRGVLSDDFPVWNWKWNPYLTIRNRQWQMVQMGVKYGAGTLLSTDIDAYPAWTPTTHPPDHTGPVSLIGPLEGHVALDPDNPTEMVPWYGVVAFDKHAVGDIVKDPITGHRWLLRNVADQNGIQQQAVKGWVLFAV